MEDSDWRRPRRGEWRRSEIERRGGGKEEGEFRNKGLFTPGFLVFYYVKAVSS
jgi:hypothetical protein